MSKQGSEMDPFREFFVKMNNDLAGWLRNEKDVNNLLEDYNNTLKMLEQDYDVQKIMVNIGENCYLKAKKTNDKIIIRCKQDIYVQFTRTEAIPVVRSLIKLYQEKVKVCKQEICKIMASMREITKQSCDLCKTLLANHDPLGSLNAHIQKWVPILTNAINLIDSSLELTIHPQTTGEGFYLNNYDWFSAVL